MSKNASFELLHESLSWSWYFYSRIFLHFFRFLSEPLVSKTAITFLFINISAQKSICMTLIIFFKYLENRKMIRWKLFKSAMGRKKRKNKKIWKCHFFMIFDKFRFVRINFFSSNIDKWFQLVKYLHNYIPHI